MQDLIVFSHLRWDFVYQRPQHLMSRLAKFYRIFFFEEPVQTEGAARIEYKRPADNVTVCTPFTSTALRGFHDSQLPVLQKLLDDVCAANDIQTPLAWFYTPMALPLLQRLSPAAVIYDCMDELSAFLNAPRQLLQRENALLKSANVVFTGGRSLYRSKQPRHPAVYCFPSSVEAAHFGAARDARLDHVDQRPIAHPRLGFFGVIDERLDLKLLADIADSHPTWQLIMVGPVVKIDAETLPKRPNIHYFGQRSYQELPLFLAGWDVCLLPFALNQATQFISPTKTLEYMAADKLIVSTPVADVVDTYGSIVDCASGPGFVAACEANLRLDPEERARRVARMRTVVEETSWDSTASRMHEIIEALQVEEPQAAARAVVRRPAPASRQKVVVIGAGPTGLSAAYHLGEDCLLLEQHDAVGGWCRSINDSGFTFDYAGHIMFSNDSYVQELYGLLLGDNVHWQNREAWVYSSGVHTRYPFQGALYGLPPEVLKDCLIGAIEARFGSLRALPVSRPAGSDGASAPSACKAESITDCCADGIAEISGGAAVDSVRPSQPPKNFEEFIHKVWGRGVATHFALPYNRKLWAVPLTEMETSWLGGRVPMPDLEEMIEGALHPVAKPMGPNARFGYPLRGGFQALVDGFLPHLKGTLRLNARVRRINPVEKEIELDDGSLCHYEHLISTMPLPLLIKAMGSHAPVPVREAASRLRHVSVRCVNLGIDRESVTDKHWIYYPGASVFHRIFVQGNASPHCNAPGGFGLTCEISYSPHKPLPCEGDSLIDRCIRDLVSVGMIREDEHIIARNQVDMPYAYVVYDHGRARNVDVIRTWLGSQSIELAGRYSEWEYYNSDHAFLAGRKAAEAVTRKQAPRVPAQGTEEEVRSLTANAGRGLERG